MKKIIGIFVIGILLIGSAWYVQHIYQKKQAPSTPTSPSITAHADTIVLDTPKSGDTIMSPLTISGTARGTWYFEASFPVKLLDANGKIIVSTPAQAQGDWMTTNFVPFTATLTFTTPDTDTGTLVLEKDNPSGLPQNNDSISIPVVFKKSAPAATACTQEAKICPDGSAVGRTGPNCEFAACPTSSGVSQSSSGKGFLQGTIFLTFCTNSNCSTSPYAALVDIRGPKSSFVEVHASSNGLFSLPLIPGTYTIIAHGTGLYPDCPMEMATIAANSTTTLSITCDSE